MAIAWDGYGRTDAKAMEAETILSEEDAQNACEDFVKVTNASIEAKSKLEAYKKNAAEGGVMGMIQQIINDAKAMEVKTIRSEEYAQKAYEDFVTEINTSIEARSKDIVQSCDFVMKNFVMMSRLA